MHKIVCKNCKNEFETNDTRRIFCSRECANTYYSENPILCVCEYCGEKFTTHKKVGRFCSNKCRANARTGRKIKPVAKGCSRLEKFKALDNLTQTAIIARHFGYTYGNFMYNARKEEMRKEYMEQLWKS